MARLVLLTDSNYIKNSGRYLGPKIKGLEVISCQNKATLMGELAGMREGIVVISCLDLVASEAARKSMGSQDAAVELAYNHIIWKLMDLIEESEGKLACGLVAPIFWRNHSKMTREGMDHAYSLAKKNPAHQIWMTEYLSGMAVGRDKVHLVPSAGRKYVESIHEFFRKIDQEARYGLVDFESPDLTLIQENSEEISVNEEEEMELEEQGMEIIPPSGQISPTRTLSNVSASMLRSSTSSQARPTGSAITATRTATGSNATPINSNPRNSVASLGVRFTVPPPTVPSLRGSTTAFQAPPPATWPTMLTPELSTSLSKIEQRIGSLEAKSLQDNIRMAALQEDQDTEANKAMQDRLTILGIKIPGIRKMTDAERNPVMKKKAEELIDQLKDEGLEYEVLFVRHLNRQAKNPEKTVLEVRFATEKQASSVRSSYIKKKNSEAFEYINVTPTVRLATRVRIEVIQAVAKVIRDEDSSVSKTQCLQFVNKPVLKVFRKDNRGHEFSKVMTFIDCVIWAIENNVENKLDLMKAYQRAGSAFRGTLPQHFVVMA